MAKAVRFYDPGTAEILHDQDVELGEPDQVRLRHLAAGLNCANPGFRYGTYALQGSARAHDLASPTTIDSSIFVI